MAIHVNHPFSEIAFACMADKPASEKRELFRNFYKPASDLELFSFAQENEITPQIAHAVQDSLGDNAPAHWVDAHDTTERTIRTYLDELDRVASVLASREIQLVALKNTGIARGIHPCPGCSPMGDLDVLVDRSRFQEAHKLLLGQGYIPERSFRSTRVTNVDLEASELGGGVEYSRTLPGGSELCFELHWRPIAGRWIQPDQEPSGGELLSRSVEIPGTPVRLLSPGDNLLQVALHTAKHTYVRAPGLRLHTDVDRIVRRQSVDWSAFVHRVKESRVCTAVYFSLAIPQQLLGTPIPETVLSELRPSRRRRDWLEARLNRAGLLFPHQKKFSNGEYLRFAAMLYDDIGSLRNSIFPDAKSIRQQYGFQSPWVAPYYHFKRLVSLIWHSERRTL